jgi:glycosyltransferase involved in cell wall biosynthesis
VIVGDAPYAADYIRGLRATTDPRVVFTGYVFGDGYRELLSNAHCFALTSEVGGTHPALLEAMAAARAVVVNDTPENLEALGDAGLSYDGAVGAPSLSAALERLLKDPDLVADLGRRALARVRAHYSWDGVTDAYERLFRALVAGAR